MADPKTNSEAYKKATESYEAAMAADAEKKKKEGEAAKKIADAQAKATPKMGSREWFLAQGLGPNGTPLADPNAVPVQTPTTAPMGSREWTLAQGVGPNGVPIGPITPTPAAPVAPAPVALPPSATEQQDKLEAARMLPGHSMGPPIAPYIKPEEPVAPAKEAPRVAEKKISKIDKLIEDMKSEVGKDKKGPNIWDIIQAAAAGWNLQTPAYIERERERESKLADIEKLSKTAQFEKALQEERLAAEAERGEKDIAARERIARIGAGIGAIPGVSKGKQAAALALSSGFKTPLVTPAVTSLPDLAGGAH